MQITCLYYHKIANARPYFTKSLHWFCIERISKTMPDNESLFTKKYIFQ